MTLQDFRRDFFQMAQREGTPSIPLTETDRLNSLAQSALNRYCSLTGCRKCASVIFTPVIGQSVYPTYGATDGSVSYLTMPAPLALAYPNVGMASVEQVTLNGQPLFSLVGSPVSWLQNAYIPGIIGPGCGRYGPSSETEFMRAYPTFLTASSALPVAWLPKAGNPLMIYFNCPFDKVYSNCFFSGRLYHSPLNLTNGGPEQVLDLCDDDLWLATEFTANRLLYPLNRAKMQEEYLKVILPKIKMREAECTEIEVPDAIRGEGNGPRQVNLGLSGPYPWA